MSKPTDKPTLAENNVNNSPGGNPNKVEPSTTLKTDGLVYEEFVAAENLNFLFATNKEWLDYFETTTDDLKVDHGLGWYEGLDISNAADADHDITVAVGKILDNTQSAVMELTSPLTKKIDANWAAGTNAGGFPSGLTLAAFESYRVFLIMDPLTGDIDVGFDTSATAANLLADATDFTLYRRIGWVVTISSAIEPWSSNTGRRYVWDDNYVGDSLQTTTTRQVSGIGGLPNQMGQAMVTLTPQSGAEPVSQEFLLLQEEDQTATTPSANAFTLALKGGEDSDFYNTTEVNMRVGPSGIIYKQVSEASTMRLRIRPISWTDDLTIDP